MNYYGNNNPVLDYGEEVEYWQKVYSGEIANIAIDFITHNHDPMTIIHDNESNEFFEVISEKLLYSIQNTSYDEIIDALDMNDPVLEVKTIPLFYDFFNGSYGICQYLSTVKTSSYVDTGTFFTNETNRVSARQKYGETHLKLGAQLGLVVLYKPSGSSVITGSISPFGVKCLSLSIGNFYVMVPKLIMRIPIVATLIKKSSNGIIRIHDVMEDVGMKETTVERRTQSVKMLINILKNVSCEKLQKRLSNIRL